MKNRNEKRISPTLWLADHLGALSNRVSGLLTITAAVLLFLVFWQVSVQQKEGLLPLVEPPHLRINEVSIAEGWVELYNPTENTISLDGWSLSTSKTDLYRFRFPEESFIEPGGYLLVGRKNLSSKITLQSALSLKRGGSLFLSEDGRVKDYLSISSTLQAFASYGYTVDGTLAQLSATPGQDNASAVVYRDVSAPVFSHESGFYDQSFTLTIDVPAGQTVYYTLDGSTPTVDSQQYTEPLTIEDISSNPNRYSQNPFLAALQKAPLKNQKKVYNDYYSSYLLPEGAVDKCTVLRAIAVDEAGMTSDVTTASYFVGYQGRKGYEDIPVLSLVSDPDGLYGMENGIMVTGNQYLKALSKGIVTTSTKWYRMRDYFNYYQSGSQWERSVHIDYFNSDKSLSFTQECGLKMHGNTSRRVAQKSFSLTADSKYDGNERFLQSFFGESVPTDKVLLTNALSPRRYLLVERMGHDRSMDTQQYQLMQVFLDGEYCGFYAMQDAYDGESYLEEHYGLEQEDIVLIKGKAGTWRYENGEEGDLETYYQPLLDYVSTADLSDPDCYAQLCTMMDMDSFIDCYAAQIYLANQDWYEGQNSYLYYSKKTSKSNPYADGRWHWLLYDLDYSSGTNSETLVTLNSFTAPRLKPNRSLSNDLFFPYLVKNPDFCRQFVTTFLDVGNGVYDEASMSAILDELAQQYKEMAWVSVLRYPKLDDEQSRNDKTHDSRFGVFCSELKEFFVQRFDCIVPNMAEYFHLSGELCTVTVRQEEEAGTVKLNTLTVKNEWSGRYYSDYPVTLTAEPTQGYRFDHWECQGKGVLSAPKEPSTELSFSGDATVQAIFVKE